jgi:hypothetical protein
MYKSLLICNFLILSAFSTSHGYGGSSVVGPPAPQFEYGCFEMDYKPDLNNWNEPKFEVSIVKFAPDFKLQISIIDRVNQTVTTESVVKQPGEAVGSPLTYKGETYRLEINTSLAPIYEDGEIYAPSELYLNDQTERSMKCKFYGE